MVARLSGAQGWILSWCSENPTLPLQLLISLLLRRVLLWLVVLEIPFSLALVAKNGVLS